MVYMWGRVDRRTFPQAADLVVIVTFFGSLWWFHHKPPTMSNFTLHPVRFSSEETICDFCVSVWEAVDQVQSMPSWHSPIFSIWQWIEHPYVLASPVVSICLANVEFHTVSAYSSSGRHMLVWVCNRASCGGLFQNVLDSSQSFRQCFIFRKCHTMVKFKTWLHDDNTQIIGCCVSPIHHRFS